MKLEYVLGVDIGTSGTKTVLFDKLGNTIKVVHMNILLYKRNQVGQNRMQMIGGKL